MKILILLSHPSQFLFYKNAVIELKKKGHTFFILIKTKDILSDLLIEEGWDFHNILPVERKRSGFHILWSLLKRDYRLFMFSRNKKIDLFMGTDASLAHVSSLLKKPCITTLEDDYEVIKNLAWLTYPFTTHILVPGGCDVGRWGKKKTGYNGYMKLAYLHPARFVPDRGKVKLPGSPYYLIRLSALNAYHDSGIKGVSITFLKKIISRLSEKGRVWISSEKPLPAELEEYRLNLTFKDMHHYLFYSEMFISDSQSMSVEAAMLGVPSIRISSFSGRISVLEELEKKYQLTFGFRPDREIEIYKKIEDLTEISNTRLLFQDRRQKMLNDKIDVSDFLVNFIEAYR